MRLNKYLSECGIDSRRKVEEYITQGRVSVNNKTVTQLAFNIDSDKDVVTVDGEKVHQQKRIYLVLNKPKGYVTTTKDEKKRKTVMDLIKVREKVFPVGRLDFNTTGVLLLTNDGDFSNFVSHPSHKVPRVYKVILDKPLQKKDRERLINGILLDGKKGRFETISFPKRNVFNIANVISTEGRNHFVKNMFQALGYNVNELARLSYAGVTAENLPPGKWRELSLPEVVEIQKKYEKH